MPSTKSDSAQTLKKIVTDWAKEMVSDRYGKAMEAAEQGIGKAVRAVYVALPNGKAEHLGWTLAAHKLRLWNEVR